MKQHSKVISGIVIGAAFGVVLCVLAEFRFKVPYLDVVINFLGSAPSLLGVRLGLPDSYGYPLVTLYFSVLGFIISWLIASTMQIRWFLLGAFLAFMAFLHWEAMGQLNRDFEQLFQLFHSSMVKE